MSKATVEQVVEFFLYAKEVNYQVPYLLSSAQHRATDTPCKYLAEYDVNGNNVSMVLLFMLMLMLVLILVLKLRLRLRLRLRLMPAHGCR